MKQVQQLLKSRKRFTTEMKEARMHWSKDHDGNYSEHFRKIGEKEGGHMNHHSTTGQTLNQYYPKAKLYHQGNDVTLLGTEEDDANSCDHTINTLEFKKPQTLILGSLSSEHLR